MPVLLRGLLASILAGVTTALVARQPNPVVDLGYVSYEGVFNATSKYDLTSKYVLLS